MYDLNRFTQEHLSVTFDTDVEIRDFIHECVMFGILTASMENPFINLLSNKENDEINSVVYGWTFGGDEAPTNRVLYGDNKCHNECGWKHITAKELLIYSLPSTTDLMAFLEE